MRTHSLDPFPFHKSKNRFLHKICHLFINNVNLWFIILEVQNKCLKESNSRSNEIQFFKNFSSLDCSLHTFIKCRTLGYFIGITFQKLNKLKYGFTLFQDSSKSWTNGQSSKTTMLYKKRNLNIQIQLQLPVVFSTSSSVFENAVQVNDELISIFSILGQALTQSVVNNVNVACSNIYKSLETRVNLPNFLFHFSLDGLANIRSITP